MQLFRLFRSRVRGKKFYIDCLSNARREDVAYLNQLLSSNLHGVNFNLFITCPDWMENQLQFYELIEQLGFVRDTKPEMFFFRNLDPVSQFYLIIPFGHDFWIGGPAFRH